MFYELYSKNKTRLRNWNASPVLDVTQTGVVCTSVIFKVNLCSTASTESSRYLNYVSEHGSIFFKKKTTTISVLSSHPNDGVTVVSPKCGKKLTRVVEPIGTTSSMSPGTFVLSWSILLPDR